jgi:hypothetical protein
VLPFRPSPPSIEVVIAPDEDVIQRYQDALVPTDPAVRRLFRVITDSAGEEAWRHELSMLLSTGAPFRIYDLR